MPSLEMQLVPRLKSRFNPLGPCGGHARVRKTAHGLKVNLLQFQSPRPLRGACKAFAKYEVAQTTRGRFNPLGPCGGHARRLSGATLRRT